MSRYLKQLSITGFKSFAKKGELVFDASITAIVGPNGSGKSNVAEAFRFVLGEQSVKSMRGKRGEDLIFGGTPQVSRANRASVAVVLDNQTRVFPLEYDEITIERVVHRDGQNEYSINGSKVRLKDVQELLAAANIGPSGHHIISQGEADRILSSSPKDRREMIEDALGLKVYQFKKQEAEKKLKKTQENIERVQSLRREVAPHLKFLERQMQKIAKKRELHKELEGMYAEYLKREDIYIAHHLDRVAQVKKEPQAALEAVHASLAAAKAKVAEAEADERRTDLLAREKTLSEARHALQSAERTVAQTEGQLAFLERRLTRAAEATHDTPPIPYAEVANVVAQIEHTVDEAQHKNDLSFVQRALTDVVHTLKTFLRSAEKREETADTDDREEFDTLQDTLRSQKADRDAAVQTAENAQAAYEELRHAIEADAAENREAEREVFRLVNEQRELEGKLQQLEQEASALERDRDEFKRELQEAVALVGRAAASYYQHNVVVDGKPVSEKAIVSEERTKQLERRRALEKHKIRLEEMGGAIGDVEDEYKEVKERDEFLAGELTDLEESVTKLEALIADLNEQLNEQFKSGIEKIGREFNQFFTLMFGGGNAKLERVKPKVKKATDEEGEESGSDEATETEEGIELTVSLPNKKVSGLEMLSGGERALTSIALIFAMSQVNPPLFVVLDETDAALDEANSRRYGDMIEALAEKSQLILITHNRETMSRAGVLYGVTMAGDGVSKLLSVKFDEAAAVAKA